jgi:hypothetical protein
MASRARILCQQIAAKQPLALSLAQCVKVCRFTNWKHDNEALSQLYVSRMAHMKNIRELHFTQSFVKKTHWDVIATMESLEKLNFVLCRSVDSPAYVDLGKRLKVKVPFLLVHGCGSGGQPSAAIDAPHLHTLMMDLNFADQVDWLSGTALTQLHVFNRFMSAASHLRVKRILCQIPQSIQVLRLPTDTLADMDESLFGDPAWKKLPPLDSLTLDEIGSGSSTTPMTVSLSA